MAEEKEKNPDLLNASATTVGRKDLKAYLKTLADLTRKISKDTIGYVEFSPILKKQLSSFKTIFGKFKSNEYCSEATIIYAKLLKSFRKFEPQYAYQFCMYWGDILPTFSSSSRADSFTRHVHKFECVVEHLESADSRWCQLIVLSILRRYTKKVDYKEMRNLSNPESNFLEIIRKTILLPRHQETSVRSNNAFFSYINSKNGFISSFQPYKIVCGDEMYILTDYELWMDCNITTKSITFVALSVTTDKNKTLHGSTSTRHLKIHSDQNALFIQSNWCLNINDDSTIDDSIQSLEIVFHFSLRIYNLILESNLKNVFNFVLGKEDNNLKTKPTESISQPEKPLLSSIIDVDFDELEKPQSSAHSQNNRIETSCEDTTKDAVDQEENNFYRNNDTRDIEEMMDTHSKLILTSDVNLSVKIPKIPLCEKPKSEIQIEKISQKRRREEEADDDSSDGSSSDNQSNETNKNEEYAKSKRVCTELSKELSLEKPPFEKPITNEVKKCEPLPMEDEIHCEPIEKAITETNLQCQVQATDGKHIRVLAEVILLAADDVIRTLKSTPLNTQSADQKFNESFKQDYVECMPQVGDNDKKYMNGYQFETARKEFCETQEINATTNEPECIIDLRKRFDENVFKKSWTIRKFVKALRTEQEYNAEVEDHEADIEDFDSVSKLIDLSQL